MLQITISKAWVLLFLFVASSGCRASRDVYRDADVRQPVLGRIFDEAPVIVIAVSTGKKAAGPPGLVLRPAGLPPFPAQKYTFSLDVRRTLRGDVVPGQRISVLGYETEGIVTGPPRGICGVAGGLGMYFLRVSGKGYRTLADEYRTWVPLESKTDLSLVEPNDIPLTIWRLLVYPYEAGIRPAINVNFSEIYFDTDFRLGRLRTIDLLSGLVEHSSNPDLEIAACMELNDADRGYGVEGCIQRILNDPARPLDSRRRDTLTWELAHVPESNARIKRILKGGTARDIGTEMGYTSAPGDIRGFLQFLAKHPDPGIARLAAERLAGGTLSDVKRK